MIQDDKDLEIEALKLLLAKRRRDIKNLEEKVAHFSAARAYEMGRCRKLTTMYNKLADRFNANFKFHEYIKDVLDQTADLMENYDAVREQKPSVQKRVQAAGRKRRTRKSNGAPASA
jgi:hypothetical protein